MWLCLKAVLYLVCPSVWMSNLDASYLKLLIQIMRERQTGVKGSGQCPPKSLQRLLPYKRQAPLKNEQISIHEVCKTTEGTRIGQEALLLVGFNMYV